MYVYNVAYRPRYQISHVRKGSPALFSGLMVGDVLLEINGRPAYEKELHEIIHMLSGNENKKIKLLIERNGVELKYEFELKNML
jgi:C-terminal processing protease CtpA/Prc